MIRRQKRRRAFAFADGWKIRWLCQWCSDDSRPGGENGGRGGRACRNRNCSWCCFKCAGECREWLGANVGGSGVLLTRMGGKSDESDEYRWVMMPVHDGEKMVGEYSVNEIGRRWGYSVNRIGRRCGFMQNQNPLNLSIIYPLHQGQGRAWHARLRCGANLNTFHHDGAHWQWRLKKPIPI